MQDSGRSRIFMQRIIPSHGRCTMFKMCSAFFRVVVKINQNKTHSPVVFSNLHLRHVIQRYKDGGLLFTPRRSSLLDVFVNCRSPFFLRPLPHLLLLGPALCVFETFKMHRLYARWRSYIISQGGCQLFYF